MPSATVDIYRGATLIGTDTAASNGTYSVSTTVALPDNATNSITAKATNADGTSPASGVLTVITDNTVPAAPGTPDLTAASDTGTSNTDNYTSDTTPTFTGTSEVHATVVLFAQAEGGSPTEVGTTLASATGSWSITSSAVPAGVCTFTATQMDAAGNGPSVASGGLSVTIDTSVPSPPSQPDLAAASDSGVSNTDNITNDPTPTFTGTATAGSTVALFAGSTPEGTATADSNRNWSITASPALTAGTYTFTATATNLAGTSAASPGLSVTIQTALPSVTVNQATLQNDPTGVSPVSFTVGFSSAVTDFTAGDVTVGGTGTGHQVRGHQWQRDTLQRCGLRHDRMPARSRPRSPPARPTITRGTRTPRRPPPTTRSPTIRPLVRR